MYVRCVFQVSSSTSNESDSEYDTALSENDSSSGKSESFEDEISDNEDQFNENEDFDGKEGNDQSEVSEDDDKGWITPSNIHSLHRTTNDSLEEKYVIVGCMSTDFAIQVCDLVKFFLKFDFIFFMLSYLCRMF